MNIKGLLVLFVLIFSVSLLLLSVVAESDMNVLRQDELNNAYQNIKCKTDFSIDVIESITDKYPSETLSGYVGKLNNHLDKLSSLADAGDWNNFREYVKLDFNSDYKASRISVGEWRTKAIKNLTIDEKSEFKKSYQDYKETYDKCQLDTLKVYGNSRITSYESILKGYEKRISAIEDKDADVEILNTIIENATKIIITPMKAELESANNSKTSNDIIKKYCLFDGCSLGINFHLGAKYEVGKLEIALAQIKKLKTSSDYMLPEDKITVIENSIVSSKKILASIGIGSYTDNNKKQLWSNIKSANNAIRDFNIKIKEQEKALSEATAEE